MQDPFGAIVGQDQAVAALRAAVQRPVHAYMFVGPAGSGKHDAARAFAAALLQDDRPLCDLHPDVLAVEREGASISVAQAREISRLGSLSPVEGKRKVLILTEFHLVEEAAPALLKTIEEATESTTFVVLADRVTKDLVTVASRCVKVEFHALTPAIVEQRLLDEGIEPGRAADAAAASFGNLTRARILAADDSVVARHELWATALDRLDGSGAVAAVLAQEVIAAIDHASEPLEQMQANEVQTMREQAKATKVSITNAKTIEASQKRQLRRLRTDELRAGLAIMSDIVGRHYRDVTDRRVAADLEGKMKALAWATEALNFNPGEAILLQGLFVKLSHASGK